jgi:signal transduction histidine kinase
VKSTNIEALLLEREARGLRVPVIARILLFLFTLANVLVSVQVGMIVDPWVVYVFVGLVSASVLINLYFYSLLRRSKHVEAVGLAGAAFDVFFVLVTFLSLQWAAPAIGLSLAFGWKTEIVLFPAVLIVINGLALRPRYPIVVAVGATLVQILCYVRVLKDPKTHFSSLPTESYAGPAIDPFQIPNAIAIVAAIGVAMAFITHVARKTIRQAIANELLNAELQREQLALLMREKVEALGKLVSGVSHEINSPAGVISSSVDTQTRAIEEIEAQVSDRVEDSKPLARAIGAARSTGEVMREAAQRISNTTKSLRAFAHLDEADFQKVDLHKEIEKALELIPAGIRGQTELQRAYGELPELYLQVREMSQVLMTILRNAFEASGGAGTVVIRTEFQDEDVSLMVSDTGEGIPPERLAALFDVTVRSKGGRMAAGFELASAQSIAHRHGGEITVESEVGQGSAFTLRLPVR